MAGELPPGVQEVKRIKAPGGPGAYWVLGADGGVFAIGGAPYLGSYMGYVQGQNLSERFDFSKGNITEIPGGYRLTATTGHTYDFAAPPTTQDMNQPNPVPAPAPEAVPEGPTGADADAQSIINNRLAEYGLGEIGRDAWNEYQKSRSVELTMDFIRNTGQYKTRFAGLEMRKQNKHSPMTEQQYIEWENETKTLFRRYELPPDFYDGDDDFAKFIGNDVSPLELKNRVENGYAAAMNAPPETRDELARLYGVKPGDLAAFFIDPQRGQEAVVKARAQAEISGAAVRSGFGGLTIEEAERFRQSAGGQAGFRQAEEGFVTVQRGQELFRGVEGQEEGLGRESQLGVAAGEGAAQEELRRRSRQRAARFEGGGGFAGGQSGVSGLGGAP